MKTAIPLAMLAYLVLTFLIPVFRHRIKNGEWPVVFHREADRFQAVVGVLLAILLWAGVAWAVLVWTLPEQSLSIWPRPPWLVWLGFSLLATGTAIELFGQFGMGASFRVGIDDRNTALVTSGLFRYTRNPVFAGLLIALLGIVLVTPSAWTLMAHLWIGSLIAIQVRLEETHLMQVHGEAYLAYARRVGRFLPGVGLMR